MISLYFWRINISSAIEIQTMDELFSLKCTFFFFSLSELTVWDLFRFVVQKFERHDRQVEKFKTKTVPSPVQLIDAFAKYTKKQKRKTKYSLQSHPRFRKLRARLFVIYKYKNNARGGGGGQKKTKRESRIPISKLQIGQKKREDPTYGCSYIYLCIYTHTIRTRYFMHSEK